MRKTLFPAALAAAIFAAGGAFAASEAAIETGTVLGKNAEAIRDALVDKGFEVRKIDKEDDELEAYAVRDKHRYEIYVSVETGAVTKVKADD